MVAPILDPTNLRVVLSACTLYAMSLLLYWVARLVYFASVVKSTGVAKVTEEWDSVRLSALFVALFLLHWHR